MRKKLEDHKFSAKYFLKIFSIISFALMIMTLAVTIAMNSVYTERLLDIIYKKDQQVLSQMSYNFDYMEEHVQSFLYNSYNDVKVQQLMYTKPKNVINEYKNVKDLAAYIRNTPFIHSYYIYNHEEAYFYVISQNSVFRKKDEMFDKEIVKILEEPNQNKTLTYMARTIQANAFEPKNLKNVYTYLFYSYIPKTDILEYALILNVDANWMLENIESMNSKQFRKESLFLMIDRKGHVLGHSDKALFGKDISGTSYIKQVISSNEKSGSFIGNEDGNILVSYATAPNSDVIFLNVSDNLIKDENITTIRNIILIFTALLVVAGILISYAMSRLIYQPIKMLKSNLYFLFGDDYYSVDNKSDEFKEMNNMFNSLKSEVNHLEVFKDSNYAEMKQNRLRKLLINSAITHDEMNELIKEYNVNLQVDARMISIYLRTNQGGMSRNTEINVTPTMLYKSLNEVCTEQFGVEDRFEIITVEEGYVILRNIQESATNDNIFYDLALIMKSIGQHMMETCGISYTCVLSPIISNFIKISENYNFLKTASEHRLVFGYDQIITQDLLMSRGVNDFQLPVNECRDLIDCIRKSNAKEVEYIIDELTDQLLTYDIEDIYLALSYISLSIIDMVNNVSIHGNVSFDIDINKLNRQIGEIETLQEIASSYKKTCFSIIESIEAGKGDKSSHYVEFIYQYIEKNYGDNTLSVNSIADSMGLTTKYINAIFKKQSGTSISNYLNQFRIEKAATLLIESKASIDEIIIDIGWSSEKYFYTLFKKQYDVTPSTYRFNHKKNKINTILGEKS